MVAKVQCSGIGVFSNMDIRCPLFLRYDLISGMCGFRWRSTSWDTFPVGPPHPLTMGLTVIGFFVDLF